MGRPSGSMVRGRRVFSAAAALGLAALAVPRVRAQGKPETGKVSIAVSGKSAFGNLPLTIAEQLGFFGAEGLEVTIADLPTADLAVQALVAGSVEVCSGAYDNTIQLQGRSNQYFQAFVLQGRAPQVAMGVMARALPGFRAVADLRGRRIGVPARGSTAEMMASLVLAQGGVAASDVNFVTIGSGAAALAAMRSGHADVICHWDPVITLLEQKGEIRIISDTRTLKGSAQVFGGLMPAGCLFAPGAFLQKNPRTAQALADAMVHALKWLQTAGPSDIIKTVPESYMIGDRGLYLASFNKMREAFTPDGILPEEGSKVALHALSGFDASIRAAEVNLARTYTNEFARRAKEKFKA